MADLETFDVLVIGGGVNGAGVAVDAASRGLSVCLVEMHDLASATSSASSKLIHGGLRYLEHYEFRLVREALKEREVLLKNAPHIMWPLRFQLPHAPHLRPYWMIRAGLFLYDHLAPRVTLKGTKSVYYDGEGALNPRFKKGFEYSDGWVDDARLVVLTAKAAAERGAKIMTRTRCIGMRREDGVWCAQLQPVPFANDEGVSSAPGFEMAARSVVNAAGPWVNEALGIAGVNAQKSMRLVKGSHLVMPRIEAGEHAYILQNEDGRIVFVIPYEDQFSLVGTTDVDYEGDPGAVSISADEVDYLLGVLRENFKGDFTKDQIVHTYSGVRPLLSDESDDPQAVTRDYAVDVFDDAGAAPIVSIFGGKITTYRTLAANVVDKLMNYFENLGESKTQNLVLPGGQFQDPGELRLRLKQTAPWLEDSIVDRYARSYGLSALCFLEGKGSIQEMGEDFGGGLFAAEVAYLIDEEWARTSDDVLWRRSKRGLAIDKDSVDRLRRYIVHYLDGDKSKGWANGHSLLKKKQV